MSQHHQQHGEPEEAGFHHVEGVGRHSKYRKRHDESIRRPSYTPQQRTGQESDMEPPEAIEMMRGSGFTPRERSEEKHVEK